MKRPAFAIFVVTALLFGGVSLKAADACPLPPDLPPDGPLPPPAPDPEFFLAEMQPAVSAKAKLSQLRQQVVSQTNSSGDYDQGVLKSYEAARKENPSGIFDQVMEVWAKSVSIELKQYIVLSALSAVKSTEQVETLRFMLASIDDSRSQVNVLAGLSKGNGLEKAKAARLMNILSKNPQIKL